MHCFRGRALFLCRRIPGHDGKNALRQTEQVFLASRLHDGAITWLAFARSAIEREAISEGGKKKLLHERVITAGERITLPHKQKRFNLGKSKKKRSGHSPTYLCCYFCFRDHNCLFTVKTIGEVLGGAATTPLFMYFAAQVEELCRVNEKSPQDVDDIKNV